MKLARPRIGLPLLTKELLEQAARRRTYVIRVLYAVLLFLLAFLMFYDILDRQTQSAFAVLGRGREMFDALLTLQFAGVYLFMPTITCGVLTQEKERSSLELLFLTRLGPWTILLEKLLSRLVPMLSFLLMSLPLLAFAYSLGGISPAYFWSGVWVLGLTVLQTGALALMCSAFFRTTVGAFVASYLLGAAIVLLPIVAAVLLHETRILRLEWLVEFVNFVFFRGSQIVTHPADIAATLFGPFVFFEFGRRAGPSHMLIAGLPMLLSALTFLLLARIFVLRRAFVPSRNPLLKFFRFLDGVFTSMNERVAKGVVLVSESTTLPEDEPIAWRETAKKSLGTVRYLFRVFVALEVPTAIVCVLIASFESSGNMDGASALLFLIWIISALLVSVAATSLIAGERSHQTLDVLLTTPLTGREIVLQKMRGVRRLILVLLVPFLTVFVLEAWWKWGLYNPYPYWQGERIEFSGTAYVACSLLSVLVYLPLIAWLSFLIGLRIRSQGKAIVAAVAALAIWCIAPFLVPITSEILFRRGPVEAGMAYFLLISPAWIVGTNEFFDYQPFDSVWGPIVLNFALYGALLYGMRQQVLLNADRWMGRNTVS
jgi:ABC-type transport system involved in multi-copper enzyme maturation permease subunit